MENTCVCCGKQIPEGMQVCRGCVDGNYNIQISNCCTIIDDRIIINGVELPPAPSKSHCTTVINNKVYIGGYEFKNGKWQRTLRALWHLWF